jgi:hypothetical protein
MGRPQPPPLVPALLLAWLLAACGQVDADAVDRELDGLMAAARVELAEGRAALESAFEGEARARFSALLGELEAAAERLGQEHLDELHGLLTSEGGLEELLYRAEARSGRAWAGLRAELEQGADRLARLVERWSEELDARSARRAAASGSPGPDPGAQAPRALDHEAAGPEAAPPEPPPGLPGEPPTSRVR